MDSYLNQTTKKKPSCFFSFNKQKHNIKLRLFCFPFAGGSALTFSSWAQYLSPDIEVIGIQPPGRAERYCDQAFVDVNELVTEIMQANVIFSEIPYVVYGHSLGSLVSFELIKKLRKNNLPLPLHFVASGCAAPHKQTDKKTYHLPNEQFVEELRRLNGTPEAVLEDKELMEFLLPILKADFQMAEEYDFNEDVPIDCGLSVFGGHDDKDITLTDLSGWKRHFTSSETITMFEGDHFFIDQSKNAVLDTLNTVLKRYID